MGREFFNLEKLRQPVIGPAKSSTPVEVRFYSQNLLSKGADIVACETEAMLGIDHVDNGIEGIRNIQDREDYEEAKPGRIDGCCGDLVGFLKETPMPL